MRYNVTLERLYHQEGEWRSTGSFGRDRLLLLSKVADLVHSWIIEPEMAEAGEPPQAVRTVAADFMGKSLTEHPVTAKAGE